MWTYMMAAARGDRANSMMASRRRNETESPKYGYNPSRPMYRTSRLNRPPSSMCTTASSTFGGASNAGSISTTYPYSGISHYGSHDADNTLATSTASGSQMFHTRVRHSTGGSSNDAYPTGGIHIDIGGEEDGTSLFSPLTPSTTMAGDSRDTSIFNCKDTAVCLVRKHLIGNRAGDTSGGNTTIVRIPSFETDDEELSGDAGGGRTGGDDNNDKDDDVDGNNDDGVDDDDDEKRQELGRIFHHRLHHHKRPNNRCKNRRDKIGKTFSNSEEPDVAAAEDEEADYLENVRENGKRISQIQTKHNKPSALRRTLNALRQRLTKRNRTKPPDWFLERFTSQTEDKIGDKQPTATTTTTPTTTETGAATRKTTQAATTTATTTTATRSTTTNTWGLGKGKGATIGNAAAVAGSASNAEAGGLASEIRGTSRLCNRLSVNPSLQSHYRWLAVVSLAVLYNIIFVVGRSVFWEINHRASAMWYFLDYLCDFIYLLDTLVHMHEGYLDQGLLVRDAYKLRRHYFSTKGWSIDLLSMLPTDLAYFWWSPSSCGPTFLPCAVIVRLNRLLRLPRMWEWFDRTETATGYPNAFRICKVVLAILVLIHWNACMYFAISFALGFGSDNWVYNLNGERNSTLQRQYIYSFYWSTLTLTTIGETPTPENDAEYLFVVADFLAGVLIFATIVGNIGSMISNMNVARVEFQNRMDGVKQYMAFRKVGHELEARVIRWFAYTWSQSGALDEERVLAALPDKLKAEIAIQVHMDTLKQVRIFHDCEPGLLEALVLKLKLQVFSPGDYICRKGDVGKEMYIVKRGKLSVVADDGVTVFATLGAGSVFGEVSVLEIAGNRTGNRRTANVRSLGYSDLFCLAKRDLWETLADYPEARATLTERGCQLLRKDGLLDEEVFSDSQRVHDSIESGIEKLEVSVENLNVRLARLLAEYTASQAKLKQRLAKLEVKYQLCDSSSVALAGCESQSRPRSGRLYSLQPKKRSRPRPLTAAKSIDNKQNTL